jgi:cytoskeletal protein CcmA (bactofilin family)
MRLLKMITASAASLLFTMAAALAQADNIWRAGARVNVVSSAHQDVWAAGALVSVRGIVRNEIWAAGAEVAVDASADGDVQAAGAIVSVKGSSDKDLYAAGARVSVDARVGGTLRAAGARVLVGPEAEIQGPTYLAGADLIFAGVSKGPATFYADSVQIDGRISGEVLVRARSVTVGKTAVIDGAVVFETFGDPVIEEGATVRGRQTVTLPRPRQIGGEHLMGALGAIVIFGVGAGLVLGVILLIAARPLVERTIDIMRTEPARTTLLGLGVLVLFPLLAVAVTATVIGMPVGLLALLALPLLLLTASVLAAFGLSDLLLNRGRESRSFGGRLLLLFVGLLILTLIGIVPVLGFFTWLIAIIAGLGALWRAFRANTIAPTSHPA